MRRRLLWIIILIFSQLGVIAGPRRHQSIDEEDFFMDWVIDDTNILGGNHFPLFAQGGFSADSTDNSSVRPFITDKLTITSFTVMLTTGATITGDCTFFVECDDVTIPWTEIKMGAGETESCTDSVDAGSAGFDQALDGCTQYNAAGTVCGGFSNNKILIGVNDGTSACDVIDEGYLALGGKWSRL